MPDNAPELMDRQAYQDLQRSYNKLLLDNRAMAEFLTKRGFWDAFCTEHFKLKP